MQVDLALSILNVEDVESTTPQLNPLDLASLTYGSHVLVVSHFCEPLRDEVALLQITSLSQAFKFPSKHPLVEVEGEAFETALGAVSPWASLTRSSLELMSHLYRMLVMSA